jgi:hypothetical protein
MSYSIIFKTKIIQLSDSRLLHLGLSGCNNDNCGRQPDEWHGKIYNKEEFVKTAEKFMEDSVPIKDSASRYFDLRIGNRYCTWYDYGQHLLRMMKRAVTFDELKKEKFVSVYRKTGVTVFEDGKMIPMTNKEFEDYYYNALYGKGSVQYHVNMTPLETEQEIVDALDDGALLKICIQ